MKVVSHAQDQGELEEQIEADAEENGMGRKHFEIELPGGERAYVTISVPGFGAARLGEHIAQIEAALFHLQKG